MSIQALTWVLNEVLSLNAQEFSRLTGYSVRTVSPQ